MNDYKKIDKKDIKKVYDILANTYKYDITKIYLPKHNIGRDNEINMILYLQEDFTTNPVMITINGCVYSYYKNKYRNKEIFELNAEEFEIFHFDNTSWKASYKKFNELISKDYIEELNAETAIQLLYYLKLLLDIKN